MDQKASKKRAVGGLIEFIYKIPGKVWGGAVVLLFFAVGVGVIKHRISWTWLPRTAAALWALTLTLYTPVAWLSLMMGGAGWAEHVLPSARGWRRKCGIWIWWGSMIFWIAQVIVAWWMVFNLAVLWVYVGLWLLAGSFLAFFLREK